MIKRKYIVCAEYCTQRQDLYIDETKVESHLNHHEFKCYVIGKLYLDMQDKKINDRYVKIKHLIIYEVLETGLRVEVCKE